jgi:DNA-directed RNA polymerase sigma subunit (sigma70/sigma32)
MTYLWPNDDGWPYPDAASAETVDLDQSVDDDALVLRAAPPHLFDALDPLERQVVRAHYGLDGSPPRNMKELRADLGLPRTEVREALASGLAKLRARLVE